MQDPRNRARRTFAPAPVQTTEEIRRQAGDAGRSFVDFVARERDPRRMRLEEDGRDSIRAVPDRPVDRALAMLPESVERAARSAGRAFDRGPIGTALRLVRESDPSELAADAAGGPLIRGARVAKAVVELPPQFQITPDFIRRTREAAARSDARVESIVPGGSRFQGRDAEDLIKQSLNPYGPPRSAWRGKNLTDDILDVPTRAERAAELYPFRTFHTTKADPQNIQYLVRSRGLAEPKDLASVHTGTINAAFDRARVLSHGPSVPTVMHLRANIQRPFLNPKTNKPWTENELSTWVESLKPSTMSRDLAQLDYERELNRRIAKADPGLGVAQARQNAESWLEHPYKYIVPRQIQAEKFLLSEGYDAIPYFNRVEHPGSISYMHLKPETSLRYTGANFDPARVGEAGLMYGLPAMFTGRAVANQRRKREDQ